MLGFGRAMTCPLPPTEIPTVLGTDIETKEMVAKSSILISDSEKERSDDEKRLNWVVKKFINLQIDMDIKAELFGPLLSQKVSLLDCTSTSRDVLEDKPAGKLLYSKANWKFKDKLIAKCTETVYMPYKHQCFLNRHSVAYKKACTVLSKATSPEDPTKCTRSGSQYSSYSEPTPLGKHLYTPKKFLYNLPCHRKKFEAHLSQLFICA
ncbi:hypothetical protein DFH09DRAFT_1093507 [Mycena vulgaris]|nr:hypothetical protein DFH09DRAFT_1093507 [Mycena vulgaris]